MAPKNLFSLLGLSRLMENLPQRQSTAVADLDRHSIHAVGPYLQTYFVLIDLSGRQAVSGFDEGPWPGSLRSLRCALGLSFLLYVGIGLHCVSCQRDEGGLVKVV